MCSILRECENSWHTGSVRKQSTGYEIRRMLAKHSGSWTTRPDENWTKYRVTRVLYLFNEQSTQLKATKNILTSKWCQHLSVTGTAGVVVDRDNRFFVVNGENHIDRSSTQQTSSTSLLYDEHIRNFKYIFIYLKIAHSICTSHLRRANTPGIIKRLLKKLAITYLWTGDSTDIVFLNSINLIQVILKYALGTFHLISQISFIRSDHTDLTNLRTDGSSLSSRSTCGQSSHFWHG